MNSLWDIYDSLIEDFKKSKKVDLADELSHVKQYVNGLTDGWYDFKNGLYEVLNSNDSLAKDEISRIKEIIKLTEKGLKNR